jgi:hypothetical protein
MVLAVLSELVFLPPDPGVLTSLPGFKLVSSSATFSSFRTTQVPGIVCPSLILDPTPDWRKVVVNRSDAARGQKAHRPW